MSLQRISFAVLLGALAVPPPIAEGIDAAVDGALQSQPPLVAASPAEAAQQIDRLLQVASSRSIDDFTYLRRVYFDTIGFPPTVKQLREFASDANPTKRNDVVHELLNNHHYGENWGRYWCDVIMYRRSEDRALRVAPVVTKYLSNALNQDRSWDELAISFITATGDIQEHGETGLIAAQAGRPEDTVSEVSRIFLGVQIQCAQCHDHFTDRWTRDQFHELAAFFPRTVLRPRRMGDKRTFEVTSMDRPRRRKPKNANRYVGRNEHFMPDLDDPQAEGTQMTPSFFLNGEQLELGTKDMDRRTQLAEWVTESDWFAKSLVNRIWTDFNGSGFFNTVDDIGPERDCEQEVALHYLARQFAANGHDLKWLIRTVTSTDVYQSSSASRVDDGSWNPTQNHPIRLRSDQLFNSVTQLFGGGARLKDKRKSQIRKHGRFLFAEKFGFDPSLSQSEISGSVPQALMLMNSKIVDRQLTIRRPGAIAIAVQDIRDDRRLIEYLYLRCLSRPPSPDEIRAATKYVKQSDSRNAGFNDLIWSLVNCSEFMYRG